MTYDNTNQGAIFVNENRQSESHPNMKGSINIEGKEYWVSAWSNTSKAGAKYLSLKVNPKEEQRAPQQQQPAKPSFDVDEDLPF